MKTFTQFCEELDLHNNGTKDTIVNFLKDALKIDDESVILNLNTNDIQPEIISSLSQRGIITSSDPDVLERIKNGITISDLIELLDQTKNIS